MRTHNDTDAPGDGDAPMAGALPETRRARRARSLGRHLGQSIAAQRREPGAGSEPGRNTLNAIILGLLGARPMSGYDIKRAFDRSLASYWNAGNSQIYTSLKALAERGLVASDLVVQESRPNRRVYHLTPAGQDELNRWLAEPVPERFTKDEFLAKLFFCGEASDAQALIHLEAHRAAIREQLAHMEWVQREYGARPSRRPRLLEFQLLVRDYKQALLQADLGITEDAIARLRVRLGPSSKPGTAAGSALSPETP